MPPKVPLWWKTLLINNILTLSDNNDHALESEQCDCEVHNFGTSFYALPKYMYTPRFYTVSAKLKKSMKW